MDPHLFANLNQSGVLELFSIVSNDGVRDSKVTNNVCAVGCHYPGQWLGFHPFGEIVYGYYNKLCLCFCCWQWSDQIDSPLGEWPGTKDGGDLLWWLPLHAGKPLAFIALEH